MAAPPVKFSGAVMLADLNDFIAPGVECIKPVDSKRVEKRPADEKGLASVRLEEDGTYVEVNKVGVATRLEPAQITLNDCLACSGCVTSAETVLIQMQSDAEVMRVVHENEHAIEEGRLGDVKHIVVSVSPQTRASFAAKYGLSPLQVARRFTTFFTKVLGARAVFDTSFGRDVALVEGGAEFVERFRKEQSLPVLASSCPGWICYAEKTHGQVLPFISTCKSPMQIMGTLIKEQYGSSIGLTPDKVYHVSVMPCYDKKLEASRDDFFNEAYRTRDVDCVLVSTEVEKMMADRSTTIHDWSESDLHEEMTKLRRSPTGEVELAGSEGSGAGGALEFVFRYAAWELFGVKVDQIEYRVGRNPDFRDVELEVDGKVVLRFAAAYGFRNIQNFVRRVKTNKSPYHYVEVMACPSACVNGGGQLRPANSQTLSKADLLEIERIYSSVPPVSPDVSSDALSNIYRTMGSSPYQGAAIDKFHTRYHAIETANISGLAVQW